MSDQKASGTAPDEHPPLGDHDPSAEPFDWSDPDLDQVTEESGRAAKVERTSVEATLDPLATPETSSVHSADPMPESRSAGEPTAQAPETIMIPATSSPAAAAETSRTIWSDAGDAPFDDRKEKIPAPARVRVKDDDEKGGSAGSETLEIVKTVVVALAIAFVLRVLLFQPFTIPSASMEPNLYEGDYIVVSKWAYGYSKYSSGLPVNLPLGEGRVLGRSPNRGDIVVFKLPRDDKTDYIKRVIGLPGDQVQMIANVLHINGQPVDDVVVSQGEVVDIFGPRAMTQLRETLPGGRSFTIQDFGPGGDLDDTPVYEVPQGFYFMMGDNRDNSIDSRVQESAGVGLVPDENLVGKAEIIMFSWEPGASLFNPVSWFANIRPSRFFRVLD